MYREYRVYGELLFSTFFTLSTLLYLFPSTPKQQHAKIGRLHLIFINPAPPRDLLIFNQACYCGTYYGRTIYTIYPFSLQKVELVHLLLV